MYSICHQVTTFMDKPAIIIKLAPLLEFSHYFISPFLCTWLTSLIIHHQREQISNIYSQYLISELPLSTIIILVPSDTDDLPSFGKSQFILALISLSHTKLELFQKKRDRNRKKKREKEMQ